MTYIRRNVFLDCLSYESLLLCSRDHHHHHDHHRHYIRLVTERPLFSGAYFHYNILSPDVHEIQQYLLPWLTWFLAWHKKWFAFFLWKSCSLFLEGKWRQTVWQSTKEATRGLSLILLSKYKNNFLEKPLQDHHHEEEWNSTQECNDVKTGEDKMKKERPSRLISKHHPLFFSDSLSFRSSFRKLVVVE